MNATPTVLLYYDFKCGEFVPGTARVEEMPNADAAINKLINEGWHYSGYNSRILHCDDGGYVLHEVMLIF